MARPTFPPTFVTHATGADLIFHGRVLSVEPRWSLLEFIGLNTEQEAHFELLELFKGSVVGSRFVLPSGSGAGPCEYPFDSGGEYLVYAFRFEGRLEAALYSRTRPVCV